MKLNAYYSLIRIIGDLQDAIDDAHKVDDGMPGQPGVRLRKVASQAQKDLKALRDLVREVREAKAEAED